MPTLTLFLRLSRPLQLLLGLLTYGLGLGIARYLGGSLQAAPQYVSGLLLLLLLAASSLLGEYFRPISDPLLPSATPRERAQLRSTLLVVSLAFVAVATLLAFVLRAQGYLPVNAALLMMVYLLLALVVSVPPLRLQERGFGEITLAFLLAVLNPAIGFLLFMPELHPFMIGFAFPLFLLALAWYLALSFEQYSEHLKYQRRNLLMLLTWPRAISAHNGLLVAAYLFLAALPFLGLAFGFVWPALLTLPVAAYQVFMLRNIVEGAKPVWLAFNVAATIVFGLTAYLITITFWLR